MGVWVYGRNLRPCREIPNINNLATFSDIKNVSRCTMRMFSRNLTQITLFASLLRPLWQLCLAGYAPQREREKLKEIIIIFVCLPWCCCCCCCCWDFIYVLYVGDTCINACFLACRITNAKFCHADVPRPLAPAPAPDLPDYRYLPLPPPFFAHCFFYFFSRALVHLPLHIYRR